MVATFSNGFGTSGGSSGSANLKILYTKHCVLRPYCEAPDNTYHISNANLRHAQLWKLSAIMYIIRVKLFQLDPCHHPLIQLKHRFCALRQFQFFAHHPPGLISLLTDILKQK